MAQSSDGLIYLDVGHTGGRDVPSDIVVPDALLEHAYVVVTGGRADFDDDDHEFGEFEGFTEVEDRTEGPLWIWRKPRYRKD